VARQSLADQSNVHFHQASVVASGLPPSSQDFGYSLGVLHHVPNTAAAIRSCTELLKPAPAGSAGSGSYPTLLAY
jgi:2-polyprenyl-3-methyl-5-hydroxy-6-metoxy-1,4-benzoquinol methylase